MSTQTTRMVYPNSAYTYLRSYYVGPGQAGAAGDGTGGVGGTTPGPYPPPPGPVPPGGWGGQGNPNNPYAGTNYNYGGSPTVADKALIGGVWYWAGGPYAGQRVDATPANAGDLTPYLQNPNLAPPAGSAAAGYFGPPQQQQPQTAAQTQGGNGLYNPAQNGMTPVNGNWQFGQGTIPTNASLALVGNTPVSLSSWSLAQMGITPTAPMPPSIPAAQQPAYAPPQAATPQQQPTQSAPAPQQFGPPIMGANAAGQAGYWSQADPNASPTFNPYMPPSGQ